MAMVLMEQMAIRLSVKYFNKQSFTFATDKYIKSGIIIKSEIVEQNETTSMLLYKAAEVKLIVRMNF